jgi:putative ABC transport system permease protein
MNASLHLAHILRSLRRHPSIVLILVTQIAFSFSIACNMVRMAAHRILVSHQESGLREAGLGILSSTGKSNVDSESSWVRTLEAMRAIEAISGVEGVAAVQSLPLSGNQYNISFSRTPSDELGSGQDAQVGAYIGSPNMVDVLGLEISKGRPLMQSEYILSNDQGKALAQSGSVLISEQLATKLFGLQNALGQQVYVERHPMRVVGIVKRLLSPAPDLGSQNELTAILPVLPNIETVDYVIRANPVDLDRVVRNGVQALSTANPRAVVEKSMTYGELRTAYFRHDVATLHLMIYALIAMLIVTVIGIAGLASFWVSSRGKSIGIRRALGASRSAIVLHFLVENMCVVIAGLCVGIAGACALNIYLVLHYGESPMPATFLLSGIIVMTLAGQVASFGPAIRASRIPPSAAMRGG